MKTSTAEKFKRNVSGTTRLNEKLAKRKLSSYLIVQQKRIARLWLVYNGLRIGDGGAFEKRQPNICTNAH